MTEEKCRELAVLGSPIAHSKSPEIHAAAYRELGLDWTYGRVQCEAAELAEFLTTRKPEWLGCSLTMPLKEEAYRLLTASKGPTFADSTLDDTARVSGVVNTLVRHPGGGWGGFNTDVAGLAAAIRRAGLDVTRTVVLGAGATAVSAVLAAQSLGAARVDVIARRVEALSSVVERFVGTQRADDRGPFSVTGTPLTHADPLPTPFGVPTLVISTLPGPAGAEIPIPEALLRVPLFDVAYDPWPSPLAERWRAAGSTATPGVEMLVEQALIQVRVFTSGDPESPLPDEARVLAAMRCAAGLPDMED